jgi:hypothetical protein
MARHEEVDDADRDRVDRDVKRRMEDLEAWLFGADAAWELGGPETWEEQLLKPKDRLEQAAALKKRVMGLRDDESLHLAGTVNPWTPFQLRLLFRAWNAAWACLASEPSDDVTSRLASELRSAVSEDRAAINPATGTAGPGSRLAVRACQCGLGLLERKPGGVGRKRGGGDKVRSGKGARQD